MQQCNERSSQKPIMFSILHLTEMIVKQENLHEGLYNLAFEFQVAVGTVGPEIETLYPGAMIGVSKIGISRTDPEKKNIYTVDAAEVNPVVKPRKKKSPLTATA